MRLWPKSERVFRWPKRLHCRRTRSPCLLFFLSPFLLSTLLYPLPTEMCVCLYSLPPGLVKRETESRRAGEDKGGHQTVNSGCRSPHQKRGEWLIDQQLLGFFCKSYSTGTLALKSILESQLILPKALHVICFMCDKTLLKST